MSSFLAESQQAYAKQNINGTFGPFTPVYIWPSWEVGVNGKPNSWSFKDMLDPSHFWSGYQTRPLVAVAEYWKANPKDIGASSIVMAFLGYLDKFCRKNKSPLLPTHYYEFIDPISTYISIQDYALVARAALYANLANGDPGVTYRVFKRCVDFLMSEYVNSGPMSGTHTKSQPTYVENGITISEFFPFHGAEVALTLSEIIELKPLMKYPSCDTSLV